MVLLKFLGNTFLLFKNKNCFFFFGLIFVCMIFSLWSTNVTYIDILAADTVDQKIVKALRKKINIASQVMGEELKSWI